MKCSWYYYVISCIIIRARQKAIRQLISSVTPGAPRVLRVRLLVGTDSSRPAALGPLQGPGLPGRPGAQSGP